MQQYGGLLLDPGSTGSTPKLTRFPSAPPCLADRFGTRISKAIDFFVELFVVMRYHLFTNLEFGEVFRNETEISESIT